MSRTELTNLSYQDFDSFKEFVQNTNLRKDDWVELARLNNVDIEGRDKIAVIQEKIWASWEEDNEPFMDNQGYNGSDPVNQVRTPSVNSEFQQQVQPLAPPTLGNVSGNPPSTASLNLDQVHQSNKGTYPSTLHDLMLRQQHQKLLDEKLRRELELRSNSARLDIMSQSLPNSVPVSAFVNPPGVSQRAEMHTSDPTLSLPSTFGQIGLTNSSSAIPGDYNSIMNMMESMAAKFEKQLKQKEMLDILNNIKMNNIRNLHEIEAELSAVMVALDNPAEAVFKLVSRMMFVLVMDQYGLDVANKYKGTFTDEPFEVQWPNFVRNNSQLRPLSTRDETTSTDKRPARHNQDNFVTPPRKGKNSPALSPLVLYTPPSAPQQFYHPYSQMMQQAPSQMAPQQLHPHQLQLQMPHSQQVSMAPQHPQLLAQQNTLAPMQNGLVNPAPTQQNQPHDPANFAALQSVASQMQNLPNNFNNGYQFFPQQAIVPPNGQMQMGGVAVAQPIVIGDDEEYPVGKSVRCYRCKQHGHYANRCPNPPASNK
jgi:hypothetical protein